MASERARRIEAFLEGATGESAGAVSGRDFMDALAEPPTDLFQPNVEFVMVGDAFGGLTATATGREAGSTWGNWAETFEEYRLEGEEVLESGDAVLFLGRGHGRTRTGAVPVEHEAAGIFRFQGDRVVRVELYLDWEQARAAAGLSS